MNLPIGVKIQLATKNTLRIIFLKPLYGLLAVVSAFGMTSLIIWSINYQLVAYILTQSGLSLKQKIEFFTYGYRSLFTSFDNLLSVSVISLAVLFGVNIAVLTYSLRRKTASARATGTSGIAATLGILSSGCAACGTSLLGPLLATLGATSITAVHNIGTAFNLIGSALLLYSIYKLALQTPTKD